MRPYNHAIRKPVRRPRVGTYLLLTLLSFALSVSLTRLFLALTGYPQLGNSVLHISHVLLGWLTSISRRYAAARAGEPLGLLVIRDYGRGWNWSFYR